MSDELTERIIGTAIEVHRILGPGLLESIYEEDLCLEFELRGFTNFPLRRGNFHRLQLGRRFAASN